MLLSGYFLFKHKLRAESQNTERYAATSIAKGLLVGVMNVLVIPFWIFWSSYFAGNKWIDFEISSIAIFSAGITAGTFLALFLYARLGRLLANKTSVMSFWGNKTVGFIFLGFAVYQLVRLVRLA